jgi:hypothetical protein
VGLHNVVAMQIKGSRRVFLILGDPFTPARAAHAQPRWVVAHDLGWRGHAAQPSCA